jgi:LCP family protein required for cell wall assembly
MIVASYDTKSKAVSMVSIPRDFYAQMSNGGYAKLNAAHAYGEQEKAGSGPAAAKEAIEKISGLTIHYYARVDFTGLKEIIDAVGGVTVDVERDFCDYGYTRAAYYKPVCFTAGPTTMNGETALKYARSRKASGVEGSDFSRSKRQQKIVAALKEKVMSTETAFNPAKVLKILESLGKHIKTDLGMDELSRTYELAKDIDTNAIINKNLDPSSGLVVANGGTSAGYILIPVEGQGVYTDIREFFKNVFAGVEVKKEGASLSYLNGTWNTYTYTKLYDILEGDGFKVVKDGGANTRNYQASKIIDYSGGQKPNSIKYLQEKLGVTATTATKPEGQKFDIQIILGSDYK